MWHHVTKYGHTSHRLWTFTYHCHCQHKVDQLLKIGQRFLRGQAKSALWNRLLRPGALEMENHGPNIQLNLDDDTTCGQGQVAPFLWGTAVGFQRSCTMADWGMENVHSGYRDYLVASVQTHNWQKIAHKLPQCRTEFGNHKDGKHMEARPL